MLSWFTTDFEVYGPDNNKHMRTICGWAMAHSEKSRLVVNIWLIRGKTQESWNQVRQTSAVPHLRLLCIFPRIGGETTARIWLSTWDAGSGRHFCFPHDCVRSGKWCFGTLKSYNWNMQHYVSILHVINRVVIRLIEQGVKLANIFLSLTIQFNVRGPLACRFKFRCFWL